MDLNLSDQCKKDLLSFARKTIGHDLGINKSPEFSENWPLLDENLGLFVTLTIDENLRGCIGYIETPLPVRKSLKNLSLSAAFNDPRFPALSENEFDNIKVEITILNKPEKIDHIDEIEVGRHGLIISQGYHRGLLLPQVATEHHMNRDTFLEHTCRKAGLPTDAWQNADTTIEIFEGYIFSENFL